MNDSGLFDPLQIRDVAFRNRIGVSPMCQYSSTDGFAGDWHLAHLGCRAVGGAGLVMTEAARFCRRAASRPRTSASGATRTLNLWPVARDSLPNTARRRAFNWPMPAEKPARRSPWEGHHPLSEAQGGWRPIVAPSPIPFDADYPVPAALKPARRLPASCPLLPERRAARCKLDFEWWRFMRRTGICYTNFFPR